MANDDQQGQDGLSVTAREGGLLVRGEAIDQGKWTAQRIDDKRLLMLSEDAQMGGSARVSGLASYTVDVFRDFLVGLHWAQWSGALTVDTGFGIKRVFFSKGQIVFAASSIMDDRLGEVMYREARITLDELTNSAAQVTKSRKFGQVLLQSGIFTNVELWDALKLQVRQILRSLFMVDRIYIEMEEGQGLAPTEVVFHETVEDLLSECFSFGCAFRAFLAKLRAETEVVMLAAPERLKAQYESGTFIGDLLELISAQPNVQDLLNTSKLIDNYTISALLMLVNLGLIRVTPDVDSGTKPGPSLSGIRNKLDAYGYVLQAVRKAFAEAQKEFPSKDLASFVASMNPVGFPALFVDESGVLGKDCVSGIFSQCVGNSHRIPHFIVRIESMIHFLLQLAGDNLAFNIAKKIRQDYRTVSV